MTSLDEYLARLRIKRLVLGCPWWDIRVCCSPQWHRPYWRYAGNSRFECEICERWERGRMMIG